MEFCPKDMFHEFSALTAKVQFGTIAEQTLNPF